jgi:hypothetical protein
MREWIWGASLVAGVAGWAWLIEPRWLKLTTVRVPLSAGLWRRPIRLLHLSDLHLASSPGLIDRAIAMGLSARPEVACVTGDFITTGRPFKPRDLQNLMAKLAHSVPTYATFGNHDGGAWASRGGGDANTVLLRELLERAGVHVLHNRWQTLALGDRRVHVVGLGDAWAGEMDPLAAFQGVPDDAPVLLLSHNPDTKDVLEGFRWNLMLSGHTHGGQVVLPWLGRRLAPVRDHAYVSGLKAWRGRYVYVSNGVGSFYGVRLGCRPEVSIVEIE